MQWLANTCGGRRRDPEASTHGSNGPLPCRVARPYATVKRLQGQNGARSEQTRTQGFSTRLIPLPATPHLVHKLCLCCMLNCNYVGSQSHTLLQNSSSVLIVVFLHYAGMFCSVLQFTTASSTIPGQSKTSPACFGGGA